MGLSFHDETTMAESSTCTRLRFGPGDVDSTLELGRIAHRGPESGCDTIDFKLEGGSYIEEKKR